MYLGRDSSFFIFNSQIPCLKRTLLFGAASFCVLGASEGGEGRGGSLAGHLSNCMGKPLESGVCAAIQGLFRCKKGQTGEKSRAVASLGSSSIFRQEGGPSALEDSIAEGAGARKGAGVSNGALER